MGASELLPVADAGEPSALAMDSQAATATRASATIQRLKICLVLILFSFVYSQLTEPRYLCEDPRH
jgi:hypothetical protein